MVTPREGEALRTRFQFSTSPASDRLADYPLLYNFGYRVGSEPVHIFSTSTVQLQTQTFLPGMTGEESNVVPVLKVCDSRQLCSTVEGEAIKVKLPTTLTAAEVDEIGVEFETLLQMQLTVEAFSLAQTVLKSLKQMPDQSLYEASATRIEKAIENEVARLKNNLDTNPDSLQPSLIFIEMAIPILDQLPMSSSTLKELTDLKDKILSHNSGSSRYQLHSSRRKRQTSSMEIGFDVKHVEDLLEITERNIMGQNSLEQKKKLLDQLHSYMIGLCKGPDIKKTQHVFISASTVDFSVQKVMLRIKKELDVPGRITDNKSNETGMIQFSNQVFNFVGEDFICVAGAIFSKDYLTEVAAPSSNLVNDRRSGVFEVRLLNDNKLMDPGRLNENEFLVVKLPIWNNSVRQGEKLMCVAWEDSTWTQSSCVTGEVSSNKQLLECHCNILGYYTILVTNSSPAPTTTEKATTVSPTPSTTIKIPEPTNTQNGAVARLNGIPVTNATYNVTFKIKEDFDLTVGNKKYEFEEKLRADILDQVEMPNKMIVNIEVFPGSIIVKLQLVDTDIKTVREVLPMISQILERGDLKVHGIDNKQLTVPAQMIRIDDPYKTEKSNTAMYAVIGSVLVSTLAILSLLIAAIILKRKREANKHRQMQVSAKGKVPTYRQFHYLQSIDGTESSLAKYRNNIPAMGTVSTLMGTMVGLPTGGSHLQMPPNYRNPRYEGQMPGTRQIPQPDTSYGDPSRKPRKSHGLNRESSTDGLLGQEEIPMVHEDKDSGIVLTDSSERQARRRVGRNRNDQSEFDVLPGTPTDEL